MARPEIINLNDLNEFKLNKINFNFIKGGYVNKRKITDFHVPFLILYTKFGKSRLSHIYRVTILGNLT